MLTFQGRRPEVSPAFRSRRLVVDGNGEKSGGSPERTGGGRSPAGHGKTAL